MRRVLMIGDNASALYHPLAPVAQKIQDILSDITLTISDQYDVLEKGLNNYHMIISYSDRWQDQLTDRQAASLHDYVAGGGAYLVLHNGIALSRHPLVKPLTGGVFVSHPPRTELAYVLENHRITEGIESFELNEEPYLFEMDEKVKREVFMAYVYENRVYDAGWTVSHGQGRMVYLQPGHDVAVFDNPSYRSLIRNACHWLLS